ncbi:MAG: hypothetical protein MMC33_000537 [Icmadophila ericetorum]|nr:hypothetical protein [Icmadophila ericetorum]
MWKRFNRPADKAIGNPTLVETTLDEKSFDGLRTIHNGELSLSAKPAFDRKQSEDVLKDLPALPFNESLQLPEATLTRPQSTASSVYPPSPLVVSKQPKQPRIVIPRTSSVYPDDVSPPDSPRTMDGMTSKSSPAISPITESGSTKEKESLGQAQAQRVYTSNLPLPRAPLNMGGTSATLNAWRDRVGRSVTPEIPGKTTKWDDYSGEPTTSELGKPAQVVPGATPFDARFNDSKGNIVFGNSVQVTGGQQSKSSNHDRTRKASAPIIREEWKGASGRTKIVPPLVDKPLPVGQRPVFVTANNKNYQRPKYQPPSKRSPTPTRGLESPTLHKGLGLGKQSPTSQGMESPTFSQTMGKQFPISGAESPPLNKLLGKRSPTSNGAESPVLQALPAPSKILQPLKIPDLDQSIKPIVPLKIGKNSPRIPTAPPPARELPQNVRAMSEPADRRSPLARNPSADVIGPTAPEKPLMAPNIVDSPEEAMPAFSETQLLAATHNLNISNEPASRFSATTYATSVQDSRPVSPDNSSTPPPLPTPPLPVSVLNRKRPVPASGVPANKTTARKPTPSEKLLDGKSLPQEPPEAEVVDRIKLLEAKLESLHRRKTNLQTVIHELTAVVQPSSIAYDMASRQEIKKTVEGLQTESAAVAKDIHETGLKLHRAMKRRDEASMFEPTGLWVRRVTE